MALGLWFLAYRQLVCPGRRVPQIFDNKSAGAFGQHLSVSKNPLSWVDRRAVAVFGPKGSVKTASTALSQDNGLFFSLLFSTKRPLPRVGQKNENHSVA